MHIILLTNDKTVSDLVEGLIPQFNGTVNFTKVTVYGRALEVIGLVQDSVVLIDAQFDEADRTQFLQDMGALDARRPTVILLQQKVDGKLLDARIDDWISLYQLDVWTLEFRIQKAIEYRKSQEIERQRRNFNDAVRGISAAINSHSDLNELLEYILNNIRKTVPHDAASIMLITSGIARVVHFSGYNQPENELDLQPKVADRIDFRQIIKDRQPFMIADTGEYPWGGAPWIRSHMGMPLFLRGEVVGFLNLERRMPADFETHHIEWLQVFAEQISTAFYSSRLYHDGLRWQKETDTLRKITTLMISSQKLDRLMGSLLVHLRTVVPYDTVTIFLQDGEYLEIVASRGSTHPDKIIGQRLLPNQHALFRELKQSEEPLFSPDAKVDQRFEDWTLLEYKRSWLGVPLLAQRSCIGYMVMDSKQVNVYGEVEIQLARSFANQTAIAIYNAQLSEETRRYANQLEERVAQRTAELQQANEKVKRNEQRYRALFEATFEGICVHENGLLLDANPAFGALFGYSFSETIGKSVLELMSVESHDIIMASILSKNEKPYEAVGLRKDGTEFHVEILGKQFVYQGKSVRIVALRDITERKRMQQQQLELALERERIQILASFITQASHEFRTPLSNINTSAYLLKKSSDPNRQNQQIRNIEVQVNNIVVLVEGLTLLSKLDGGMDLAMKEVALEKLVAAIYANQQPAMQKKTIQSHLELPIDSLMTLGDVEYLGQAITNILDNAIYATPLNGTITIHLEVVASNAVITIADTGVGINASDFPHIFERFYRGDKAGTTRGFGLGLPIAKAIIERHRGRINVESEAGKGTTIQIVLPTAPPTEQG